MLSCAARKRSNYQRPCSPQKIRFTSIRAKLDSSTLEPRHLLLAPSNCKVRVLSPIGVAQSTAMMTITETELLKRGALGSESIGDDPLRFDVVIFQHPP